VHERLLSSLGRSGGRGKSLNLGEQVRMEDYIVEKTFATIVLQTELSFDTHDNPRVGEVISNFVPERLSGSKPNQTWFT
jgi:hypothetical protein